MNRDQNLQRLAHEEFDLCIIGGGASGAGCALDAALRGLKVALVEKTDFAAETSSRSTKLVHGGVRYLEQAFKKLDFAQLRQVRHGLEERRIVLRNAPHLARPLGLITPVFSWWEGFYFSVGLKLYDWFARKRDTEPSLPPSRWLNKREALERMPGLSPNIHSAVLYFDGQMDDARYCLALAQTAAHAGVALANHLEVIDFQKDTQGKLTSALMQDRLGKSPSFDLKAKRFLNCTGPYADAIRQMAKPESSPRIRPSKGVHLVLPLEILGSSEAMLIPKTRDGRMVFAIPFEGSLLLGTTDEPYAEWQNEPVLERKELDFLLETLQPFVAKTLQPTQVKSGFGGIRPLIGPGKSSGNAQTKSLLRDHEVEQDPHSGLISLLGGKWTTYRLMARDAVDVAARGLPQMPSATGTEQHPLFGAENHDPENGKKLREKFGFDEDVCQHLAAKYGNQADVLGVLTQQEKALGERILPTFPFLIAEIEYAVREEMAQTLRDFLARRIRLEILDWEAAKQAAPIVAQWMGRALGWSESEQKAHTSDYCALLDSFQDKTK